MVKKEITTYKEYLEMIDDLVDHHDVILFRGQSENFPLLPAIARKNPKIDTTLIEKEMLSELKRRTQLTMRTPFTSDWEWLIYAQHFGMKTRLLDWTSNPLTALWFACSNEYKIGKDSYVYVFTADSTFVTNVSSKEDPFMRSKTKILKPALNNERIVAQAGWFTAHKYSDKVKEFVSLETNTDLRKKLIQIKVPSGIKLTLLDRLSIFGINSQNLFPDITGICSHLNWMYTNKQ